MRKLIILVIPFLISSVFWGCAPKLILTTELDQLFDKNFESLNVPEIKKIKTEGKSKEFKYATFDEVWDSAVVVLMQEGIIARSLRDRGVIITIPTQQYMEIKKDLLNRRSYGRVGLPPFAVFVERDETVTVYLYLMEHLYMRLDKSKKMLFKLTNEDKEKIAETFFGKLATQVYVGEKWKYLNKTENWSFANLCSLN